MIVTALDVRSAVEATLQAHLPTQLEGFAARRGRAFPPIKSWRRIADFLQLEEQDSPACVVTSPGLDGEPIPEESGGHRAPWRARVFVVARGRTYEETADRVADYTAAVRAALLSDPALGGLADQVIWRGESYTELDRSQQRTIAAGSVTVAYAIRTDLGDWEVPIVEASGVYSLIPVPIHPAL